MIHSRNLRTFFWNTINTTENVRIELLHAFRKDEKNGRLSENYEKRPWAFLCACVYKKQTQTALELRIKTKYIM